MSELQNLYIKKIDYQQKSSINYKYKKDVF